MTERDDNKLNRSLREPFQPGPGMTAANGTIIFGEPLRGALFRGRQISPHDRDVVIAVRPFPYATDKARLHDLFDFGTPGIAPMVFMGYPDQGPNPTADELRELRRRAIYPIAIVAEVEPPGVPLSEAGALDEREAINLGIALCDTILEWEARRGHILAGLRPETVYVTGPRGQRTFSGVTPRVFLVIGNSDSDATFSYDSYEPPTANTPFALSADEAGFVVAQLVWYALLQQSPYKLPKSPDDRDNMWNDRRNPFTGSPEIGVVLEAALVADDTKRTLARELRAALAGLLRTGTVSVED